jgi:membrane protein YdbS with pleckstrin-like domain
MSKFIGMLLLVALAVRLVTLFFFKQNAVLNEISLVLFISIFVVTVIVMLVKWWKWRTK